MIRKALLLICLLAQIHAIGQNINPLNITNVVPASPEVAAIGKYVDIPVGYSTGVPAVGIPFYTVKSGTLTVPVSLSYNASGIRVEEAATSTGLGWALQTGPTLTRSVRGLPDDTGGDVGYMTTTKKVRYIDSLPVENLERINIFHTFVSAGALDIEPDIFNFSVMGYSGKFYFNQDSGKFIHTPYQNIKIEYTTNNEKINSFKLTLPDGVVCYFGTSQDGLRSSSEVMNDQQLTSISENMVSQPPYNNVGGHVSSWSIMDIISPAGRAVKYYYTTIQATEFGRAGESVNYKGISGCDAADNDKKASFYRQLFFKPVLQRISGDLADVDFIMSAQNREDVVDEGKALDTIIIKNKEGKKIKAFVFNYSYTTSSDVVTLPGLENFEQVARKRMFLNSIREMGDIALPPYEFTYNNVALPSRLSASQDFWGYYNGKANGQFLTPRVKSKLLYTVGESYLNGADRRIDSNYSQAGMLKKIKYPAGGTTEYFYEANKAPMFFNSSLYGYERSDLTEKNFFFPKLFADAPDTLLYVDTFTVADIVDKVRINSQLQGCSNLPSASCRIQVTITGITDPAFQEVINTTVEYYLDIPQGQYEIRAVINPQPVDDPVPMLSVSLHWSEQTDPYNIIVGGHRARKIVSADSAGNTIARSFAYKNFTTPYYSSGFLAGTPTQAFKTRCGYGEVGLPSSPDAPTVLKIVSNSAIPLNANGAIINYLNVTEYYDTLKTSYKTEYTFSNNNIFPIQDPNGENYPFATNVLPEWQNGLLISKKQYELYNGAYRVLVEENNYYKEFEPLQYVFGIRTAPYPTPETYGITSYYFNSEWYLLDSTRNTSYAYPNNVQHSLIANTKTTYNNKYLPAKVVSANSLGKKIENKTWYPSDYNDVAGFSFPALLNKYIMQVPVKQEVSVNQKIRTGQIVKYNENGLPVDIYAYESATLNDTIAHNKSTVLENNYVLKQTIDYLQDNPVQIVENNFFNAFIWDYSGNYPLAAIKNSQVSWVGYTSFEDQSSGNWVGVNQASIVTGPAPTGKKYLNQSGFAFSVSGIPSAEKYLVSYWSKNGAYSVNGTQAGWPKTLLTVNLDGQSWSCYLHLISGQTTITVSGSGSIDELRLYPETAQMITYTYEPLVGMTSQCDANNNIAYYEYDGLTRLLRIRDRDKNILKHFDYQYQVVAHANPVWQATGATRCKPCSANENYTDNIVQHEEHDTNPNSSTYGQTRWVDGTGSSSCFMAGWQNTTTPTRCKTSNGENTGEIEQEQRDMNPCSPTYNQTQWVVVEQNCNICSKPPNWQPTGVTRCAKDANDNNTGSIEREEKDLQVCSPTWNQSRWIPEAISCEQCPTPANWQPTGNVRCATGSGNNNTGYQEIEEQDISNCSPTLGQLRWVAGPYNTTACPVCTNCNLPTRRCYNNVCTRGTLVYTASVYNPSTGMYDCTYHYEWPDGFWSIDYTVESPVACL